MLSQQMKLENPERIKELKPQETLKKIGLQNDNVVCDIGAGSGIFTLPAADLTKNIVYALEINEDLLAVIGEKAKDGGFTNIELIKVSNDKLAIKDCCVDLALMVTVLHEIIAPALLLKEAKRILKDQGKLAIIEFHKRETPTGPPLDQRIGKVEAKKLLMSLGFKLSAEFDLGENYYCLVLQPDAT
jgi:ubiquinone/menaquinone biosynthesis C-methylase UbiE